MRKKFLIAIFCIVCLEVQARDVAVPPTRLWDCLIFVDYLPFRFCKYNGPDIFLYEQSPLVLYVDTSTECVDNNKSKLLIIETRYISYLFAYSKKSAKGYLKVNYDVYQFLVDKKIETMQHSYRYYINGKIIDERNYEQLLQLRKSNIKSVNVELDSQTDAIIVEIKTKRRM